MAGRGDVSGRGDARHAPRLRVPASPRLSVWLATILVVLGPLLPWPRLLAAPPPGDGQLLVRGQPAFLAGVNYPWRSPQDFGTGEWGHSGVSNPTTYAEVDTDFANLAAQGVRVVKWRVFNDGRYSPEFDARGFPTGLDDQFFPDLDAALALARKHDLRLVLVLFSSGFWTTNCTAPEGVHFGGHADLLLNPAKRHSLVQRVLIPLLQHLGADDRVLAYEILAEPDWGITELHRDPDWRLKVPLAPVRALVAEAARAIHTYSPALATLETNRASHLPAWRGLGLDYYSFSWYDWVEPYDPLDVPARALGVDRPVVLGEFPADGSAYYGLSEVLELALRQGYAGAFGWSYWGADQMGEWAAAVEQYLPWARTHWPAINLGAAALPPPRPPAPLPLPFGYGDLRLSFSQGALVVQMDLLARDPGRYTAKLYLRPAGQPASLDQALEVAGGKPQTLAVRFSNLDEGRRYQLSLGVFDERWRLRKWYDSVASFIVRDGQLEQPQLSVQEREDPCARVS
ncbi:MAG: hypothetical protein HY690_02885 [Chloroflexi bacterium]|nr:hypothetical protein [Chloroflexota bacterium]